MTQDRIIWKIAGEAGFGIKVAGQIFSRTFARGGYNVFDYVEYPSLIRGGHNVITARVDRNPFYSHAQPVDVLVALNRESIDLHLGDMRPGGTIIHDPAVTKFDLSELARDDVCMCEVPLLELATAGGGPKIMANSVALGATVGMVDFDFEVLAAVLGDTYGRKGPKIVEANVVAARAGHDHVKTYCIQCGHTLTGVKKTQPERIVVDGNEAVGMGMIAAGCKFYAAYPMTPASGLLHFMAAHEKDFGVVVKHTEDEIAAMNMTIGAAFAGARAMCATSGGGFSLMVEGLGLAGMSESPIVVGVFERPGPGTGLPTWTEQGDLRFVIHAAQGEFPRIVLAPGDKQECFELTAEAFNLAERFQTPVIIISDMFMQESHGTMEPFDAAAIGVDRGKLIASAEQLSHDGEYKRYELTDDGISPRALPGLPATQIANSYEHDEYGLATEDAAMRAAMMDKRARKLEGAVMVVPRPNTYGPEEADLVIVGWGSTKGPVLEAMSWLEKEGIDNVGFLQVVTLHPFPAERVRQVLGSAKAAICVEANQTGQLAGLIREHCLLDVDHRFSKYDGRPFFPEEIVARVKEVLDVGRRQAEAI